MITYRSLKKFLGETSLERKCRYLFGAALLGLITGSFWLHAAKTRQLVRNQQVLGAQTLLSSFFLNRHLSLYHKQAEAQGQDSKLFSAAPGTQSEKQSFADFAKSLRLTESAAPDQPRWFLSLTSDPQLDDDDSNARRKFESGDQDNFSEFIEEPDGSRSLKYVAAIRATSDCLACHQSGNQYNAPEYTPNQFVAVATVTIPMAKVDQELSVSNAVFVGSAIITTGLAMLAAYIIVRYIIVKPVLHLKDVSDAIAMGNLTQRAEITTGDEFEELSHAFNRMLRHMTTVNTELRTVNDNLDAKVDLLAQANMELFNSNRLKNDFLATVSHELRTPLNSILGFSDILAGAVNLDERQHRYVDNIQTSGRSLMTQINDLLDLAKIESGQLEIQAGSLDMPELIDRLVQQVTPLAEQKNINLRVTHAWPALPKLHQDAGKVRQILTNLLSNAIKFTPEGGRVRVSSHHLKAATGTRSVSNKESADIIANDDLIEIAVEDTGIGIPMQQQEDIFEKFRQGATLPGQRDHAKREYGGTGLGLSIVRELSRLLGGDVNLESEFGKGSVFTVTLPMIVRPVEKETKPTLDSPSTGLSRITSVNLMNPAS
ncbi:MAG: ATP-binding protein [Fuerstiella sp.]|nr:ATP-binding protein [Fuerstiella sp.]